MAVVAAEPHAGASSCTTSPALRVLDTVVVPPPPLSLQQQGPASQETSLPLTFFDVFWLNSPPVERLFLYRLAPDADVDSIISSLRTSLSEAVRAFYPLAGRIRLTPGTPDGYELHYRPGDGVAFTVAEYERDVDGLATDDARDVAAIAPLVPPLPEGGAVLALQATLLAARRGLAIGVTVHHAACDGAGSTHFLHTWALMAAVANRSTGSSEQEAPPPPVIDRTLIADLGGVYDVFYQARPTRDEMEFVKMAPDQLLATFRLSRDDLQRVKDAVAAEAAARGTAPPRCSSLVATLGLIWSCYLRAKKASGDAGEERPTCLLFAVDHRSRMRPPVPDKYLGNCVGPAFAVASRDELSTEPGGGLLTACTAVADAIQEAVSEIGTPGVDKWMERIREAGKRGVLSLAGSPRFRVYEIDFGFGTPGKVDIVSVARTGAVALAESRDAPGGGMEVGISLQPDGMDRFRKCFADAMAWLSKCMDA